MCQGAARKTDLCAHGGVVKDGSPDTAIGGLPAARWGDGHLCPIHPPGRITSASTTVFINKVGAARKLDTILCAAPATPAPGAVSQSDLTLSVYKGSPAEKGNNPYLQGGDGGDLLPVSADSTQLGGYGGSPMGGGAAGSVGAAGGMAFQGSNEKSFFVKALFDVEALLAFALNIDVRIGNKFGIAAPPVPAPDAVKIACATVFIGG